MSDRATRTARPEHGPPRLAILRARVVAAVATGLVCAATAGCTGASRTTSDYQHKAANAAQATDSAINVAELDAEQVRDDKVLGAELRVSLEQAYSDASSTMSGFNAVLPPHSEDAALQKRVGAALSAAVTLLLEMRVRAGQGRENALPSLIPRLRAMSARLKRFEQLA
jgi:hypothetical protein